MFEAIHSSRTLPDPRTAIVSATVRFRALTIIGESFASGSTISSAAPAWPLLTCWDGDLNSHQAFLSSASTCENRGSLPAGHRTAYPPNCVFLYTGPEPALLGPAPGASPGLARSEIETCVTFL